MRWALALIVALLALPGRAEERLRADWAEVKCARYTKAWHEALRRYGRTGLSEEFLSRHDAFLASACMGEANVCPRSPEELALANVMVIQAMNAGTASTFPPFACRGD